MKKLKLFIGATAILFLAVSCESVGLFGFGGVRGSDAKKEILATAEEAGIINAVINGTFNTTAGLNALTFTLVIDKVVVPGLAGIKNDAHYSRPSVDHCKKQLMSVGLILGTWIGSITCELNETPKLLQIGDGDTGNVIQLGPLGL